MVKNPRQEWKIYKNVFDEHSLNLLEKMRGQAHYDELQSPIALGKEANIFTASKDENLVIVKIYRLENCDFNKMYSYLAPDPRFHGVKKKNRLIVFAWVQREYRNLLKAREVIRVPQPIAVRDNIIIMEFIGGEQPAPKLKDQPPKNMKKFFERVVANMKSLYKINFVHADLSDFNILNHEEEPVFIDFSQSTTLEHPQAEEFLIRDVKNVCAYFNKQGLKVNPDDVLREIRKK